MISGDSSRDGSLDDWSDECGVSARWTGDEDVLVGDEGSGMSLAYSTIFDVARVRVRRVDSSAGWSSTICGRPGLGRGCLVKGADEPLAVGSRCRL